MNKEGSFINVEDDDIALILAEVLTLYGYDFSNYSKASLRRRINRIVNKENIVSIAEFRYKLVHDELYFNHFLEEVTVNVTEMFRDPIFFKSLSFHSDICFLIMGLSFQKIGGFVSSISLSILL